MTPEPILKGKFIMKKVLSIAGSDCSGGAGIQADIKTITAHKLYAMSVITALTAQNTTGVSAVLDVEPDFVAKQLDMVFTDIRPDAVKIGMVSNSEIISIIASKLMEYGVKNIVLDPVMISTSGSKLMNDNAAKILITKLMPLATIITPNLMEAECLSGISIGTKEDMIKAAKIISEFYSGNILIKGGHLQGSSDDLLYSQEAIHWFEQTSINNPNTHGTGCTLSSAIACNLAGGKDINSSVEAAKAYITGAVKANLDIGKGNGPLNHCWNMV
jgi:hydroxymethylpyrimidine/phosphomethylpyrimidine kinase